MNGYGPAAAHHERLLPPEDPDECVDAMCGECVECLADAEESAAERWREERVEMRHGDD